MKQSKSKKKKIEYGNVDIPDEAFLPKNIKHRISILVQGNVLAWFKEYSNLTGVPYQNLMQIALAQFYTDHLKADDLAKANEEQRKRA